MKCSSLTITSVFAGIALFVALFVLVPLTRAEGPAVPANVAEQATERQENRELRRSAISRSAQDRIINLSQNVITRLTSATERMNNIVGRLEARIEKLQALGVDTTPAEAKLNEAKNALLAVEDVLSEFGSIETMVRGETPRDSFSQVRTQFIGARDLIKQARSLLIETVALLKEAVRNADLNRGVSDAVRADEETPSTTE